VKRISQADRHLFCRLVLALADDDKPKIIELMKEAGFKSRNMDPDVIYAFAKVSYDEDSKELTKGLHIQMFMEELQKRDPIEELPYEWIVIGRCSIILRGLAHALQQPRSTAKLWRPIAERVLKEDL
jgi:predicted unusual protein kinase regulating ubiquinone biosynthesis (AarF/ABC1/UbiB family)